MTKRKCKIVVLDAGTIHLEDGCWDPLREYGEVVLHEHTDHGDEEQIRARCQGARVVLTNKVPFGREVLQGLEELEMIGVLATGYNIIDLGAAKEAEVVVCNVPSYSTSAVAQHTLALILELTNRVGLHTEAIQEGEWVRSRFFYFQKRPVVELTGRTVGLIGFGEIATEVGRLVSALGAKVLAYRRNPREKPGYGPFAWAGSLEEVFANADVISLHCPLTGETEGMINRARLQTMKPTAFLVNTARGPLVVEKDLVAALRSEEIAGAALRKR